MALVRLGRVHRAGHMKTRDVIRGFLCLKGRSDYRAASGHATKRPNSAGPGDWITPTTTNPIEDVKVAEETPATAENGHSQHAEGEIEIQIVAQFVRDLSFESPNVESLIDGPGDNPNLNVEINVNGKHIRDQFYESTINFKAHATNAAGVIYDLEVVYGGVFRINKMPPQSLQPFLLVECPTLLFPFLRRLIADLTREGGFPPLFLDPINFAALYMQRQQSQASTTN